MAKNETFVLRGWMDIDIDTDNNSSVFSISLLENTHIHATPYLRCQWCSGPLNQPPRSTQPGHPFVGRHNKYQRWLQPLLEKKWQVLSNGRPCYQDCWYTDLVRKRCWLLTELVIQLTTTYSADMWSLASSIGCNCNLRKVLLKGMSFHATDLAVCVKIFVIFFFFWFMPC